MKPQTHAFLTAADEALSDAKTILNAKIPRQAARLAYYAQFHAARALIFERCGRITKTHRGVDREFHKVAASEPSFAPGFAALPSKAYNYKEHADYSTDFTNPIPPALAAAAVAIAERSVATVRTAFDLPTAT